MKRVFKLFLGVILVTTIAFSNNDESKKLMVNKCASCHLLGIPNATQLARVKAPPMNAVLYHVKSDLKDFFQQEKFIRDYSLKPQPKTAVCTSNKIEKFGVMPSMKGRVTESELKKIAHYLIENFPSKEFVKKMKERKLYEEIVELRHSAFLINQKRLPKLTKLLIENWGKGKLGLNRCQKSKLLLIRQEIISTIHEIQERVSNLEDEIIEMTIDGDDNENIEVKVNEVAKLKAKATMTQIKCLKDTLEILNDKQLYTLLPMWGM